jgi:D-glycero-D-manno-heptose 1,7-bisphosphate phosphatase
MKCEFAKRDIKISKTYFCPHHPNFSECECRKPKPKMILDAKDEFDLDLKNSILIGDKTSDIEAGESAGVGRAFLIKSLYELDREYFNSLNELILFLRENSDNF